MARELQQTAPDDRRRRVQRLKKMIIGIVIVGLLIPILCCVYLICRLHAINGTLRDLEQRLGELDARDRERQTLLQQLQSETAIQQGVQTQEEVTSGEVSEHTPESDPGQEMIHKVYLTFDDGPSSFTDRLLDCLESNNAKATFFMVGKEIDSFPDEVKRMEALGCELGNHTYSHADLTTLSPEDMSAEIAGVDESLVNLVGHGATVLRPPYGSINDSVRSTVGTPMILWSIDTLDWETQDAQNTVDTVMSQVQDGSIILMHDIFSTSVDAAEIFIPKLIEEGYQLVTIHELAKIKGTELQTGIAYGDFTG